VTKADDSSLDPEDLRAVEERARQLLDRASAWDRFPVPLEDILAAANVSVAQTSLFDPVAIMEYLAGKAIQTATVVKSALGKLFGLYDSAETLIHIDDSAIKSQFQKDLPDPSRNRASRSPRAQAHVSVLPGQRTTSRSRDLRPV
jgi:hypothetical protein